MFKRLLETVPSDASPGPAIADGGSTSPVDSGKGSFETPNFSELANWDDSLAHADPKPSGVGATPKAELPPTQSKDGLAPPAIVPPAAAAPVATPPVVAPAPDLKAAVPPAPAGTETLPATPEPPKVPEPVQATMEQHRAKAIPQLSKLFEFTPEEVEAFKVEPEKVLPTLAARVAFESTMMAYQAMQTAMPQMIQGFMAHERQRTERNDQFFKAWPAIKQGDANHEKVAVNSIKAFRAANPDAKLEDIIRGAGALACLSLGLPITGALPPASPVPPVPPAHPRPAGAGAGGAPLPSPPVNAGVEEDPVKALILAQERGELY